MAYRQVLNAIQTYKPISMGNKVGYIGIDFGLEKISFVQIRKKSGNFRINAAASVSYPIDRKQLLDDPFSFKSIIKKTIHNHGFQGTQVVVALPPTQIQLTLINYQCQTGESHDVAVGRAVLEQFKDKLQGTVVDYLAIRPKVEEQVERSALVAIAKHDEVVHFLENFRLSGLKVKTLEIGPVAIKRLLTNLDVKNESLRKIMSINFASASTYVTVLWGGDLLLDREIKIGQNCIIKSVSDALNISVEQAARLLETHGFDSNTNIDQAENSHFFNDNTSLTLVQIVKPILQKLAQEIKKVLIYTAAETRGGALDKIYILGSVARWPMVDQYLTELINLPIETINPFFGFSVNNSNIEKDILEPVSGIAVATGLALQGLDKDE